jgi:hypothetical protein
MGLPSLETDNNNTATVSPPGRTSVSVVGEVISESKIEICSVTSRRFSVVPVLEIITPSASADEEKPDLGSVETRERFFEEELELITAFNRMGQHISPEESHDDRPGEIRNINPDPFFYIYPVLSNFYNKIIELNKSNRVNTIIKTNFINALINQYHAIGMNVYNAEQQNDSPAQILASAAIQIAEQTVLMLERFLDVAEDEHKKNKQLNIIQQYEAACKKIYRENYLIKPALKKILVVAGMVIIAAAGFVLGAVITASIGLLVSALLGYGSVMSGLMALANGSANAGVSCIGMVAGSVSYTSALVGGRLLFKTAKLPNANEYTQMNCEGVAASARKSI